LKILLSTLNAKFIHSSLALAYLQEFCSNEAWDINIREFTINEKNDYIMAEIFMERPDILCFSCYIWNIEAVLDICKDYKKVAPQSIIVLGGPEVSYDSRKVLQDNMAVDYVIRGEGEFTLRELLQSIYFNKPLENIKGMSYRHINEICENPDRELISDLDVIPTPYKGDLKYYKNKIIYYETSRGCPFNCAYCLSSTIKGVRFFSLDRVKKDLSFLIKKGVKQVKFVDRTFNCNEKRAWEIMKFIIDEVDKNKTGTSFHFEICADLLSEEMLLFLSQVPAGLFDFEIGVQSTCTEALKAVNRKSDLEKLSRNVNALKAAGNIRLHLDLLAGLPCESYRRFACSFNYVYGLNPDVIQLGFLKLLKGSLIREKNADYGYKFQTDPPYQVLKNNYINYEEMIKLSRIEDILERYYNSGVMFNTVSYIIRNIYSGDAFCFLEKFAAYWQDNYLFGIGHRKEAEYSILKNYIDCFHNSYSKEVNELLKYDYLLNHKSYNLPRGIESHNPENINEILYSLLKNKDFINKNLSHMGSCTVREIKKQVHLEYFKYDPADCTWVESMLPFLFIYNPVQKKAKKVMKNGLEVL